MPRRGIRLDDLVDTATALVDTEGLDALTLSRVAREIGVKPPSLYSHVADLDTLRRHVALRATRRIGERMASAAMGRAGRDALAAVAAEVRSFATEHPDLYELTNRARPNDDEYAGAALRAIDPLTAALREYALEGEEVIHAARTLRSAVHGFVSLEIAGGFGIDVDVDQSFDWMVDQLAASLDRRRTVDGTSV